jgi:hypothetical protein
MIQIRVVVIVFTGFLMLVCIPRIGNVKADDKVDLEGGNMAMTQPNQVFNDEGYGNADEEYYNSEDDVVNDEDTSGPKENEYVK